MKLARRERVVAAVVAAAEEEGEGTGSHAGKEPISFY